MDTTNISCICETPNCTVEKLVENSDFTWWDAKRIRKYYHKRTQTIEHIYRLNRTLTPPLVIENPSFLPGSSKGKTATSTANKKTQTSEKNHKDNRPKTVTEEGVVVSAYLCHLCGKGYNWRTSLRRHIKEIHQEGQLACPYCEELCESPQELDDHVRKRVGGGGCCVQTID